MAIILNDYNEKGVLTPKIWYEQFGMCEKMKELGDVKSFIITFPYMKNFIQKVHSLTFRKIEWYPGLEVFDFKGDNIGFAITRPSAPLTTILLEDLIYMGGKYFILAGGVGVLDEEIKRGDIIIPNGAIRDEGTSYHYLPTKGDIKPS